MNFMNENNASELIQSYVKLMNRIIALTTNTLEWKLLLAMTM